MRFYSKILLPLAITWLASACSSSPKVNGLNETIAETPLPATAEENTLIEVEATVGLVEEEGLQVVEATLESVRAGAIPLASATLNDPPINTRPGMKVTLSVSPQTTADLYLIRVTASCLVHGRNIERHASTMLWRPS